tara:strand:+ start:559 stop:672 length:114 start_codon:yes stop_codon:yes gene_type:complete
MSFGNGAYPRRSSAATFVAVRTAIAAVIVHAGLPSLS